MRSKLVLITLLSLSGSVSAEPITQQNISGDNQPIFGLIEKAILLPNNLSMNVKMDTGALTSSLDAKNIEQFSKNGSDWVRFIVVTQDDANNEKVTSFERKIVRIVKLRGAGGTDIRPSVLMRICIGNKSSEEQFTLRDRGDMKYPILIGRKTIEHLGLIDVKKQFTIEPQCNN